MYVFLRYEIHHKMADLQIIRDEWNRLADSMKEGVACHSFEWFDCWYRAFCKSGNVRVVLVYQGNVLRAILPGMIAERSIKGITCTVFSYAGNGHSPRCGVIAAQGDTDAILAALSSVTHRLLGCSFDFSIFPGVMTGTDTYLAIQKFSSDHTVRVENRYDSPTCDISGGWENYLKSRSKSLRDRFKNNLNRVKRLIGEAGLELVNPDADADRIIERLSRIEATTWQHKNGTGLFSTPENTSFYSSLIRNLMPVGLANVAFVSAAGRDIAFDVSLISNDVVFTFKVGYDPEFAKCSPGILSWYFLTKHYADLGFREYDLLGETSEEKRCWATHYQEHSNFWIFNGKSPKGFLVRNALKLHTMLKGRRAPSEAVDGSEGAGADGA